MNKLMKQMMVLFTFLCLSAGNVFAQAPTSSSALDRLDALLGNIETLTADVVQLIVESDGGVLEESEIQMLLKKPDG
ncbi:MAG: outer membrane lipoprotein-sorting protein, partial [Pseudohongiellaceae bacterium]